MIRRLSILFSVFSLLAMVAFAVPPDRPVLARRDISIPLREMRPAPVQSGVRIVRPNGRVPHPNPPDRPVTGGVDEAAQMSAAPSAMAPSVINQFNGIGSNNSYTVQYAPPDTDGDVSATQYVQVVNVAMAVFNKSTGAYLLGPVSTKTLWSGFGGGCQDNNDGDGTVNYDQIAHRWVITQFSVSTIPYTECIAVSTSDDATGSYARYAYTFTNFNDYPKVGIWVDASDTTAGAYYITYNMFIPGSFDWAGGEVCAYDRSKMLTGAAANAGCVNLGLSYGGFLAADLDGPTPAPSGEPAYLVGYGNDNASLDYWTMTPNFSTSTLTVSANHNFSVPAFSPACGGGACVPQSGTTNILDSLADRLMNRVQYRNFGDHQSLVVSHSVTVGSSAAPRWYLLSANTGTLTLSQTGSFSPDTLYRWMPSIAMDNDENIALGYSGSSSSAKPSVRYTGRLSTDAANTMQSETVAFAGGGSQTGGLSRWGDYSQMSVDPVDDCTFWFTSEYIPSNGSFNWSTRIVSFRFPTCGGAVTCANQSQLLANPDFEGGSTGWKASKKSTIITNSPARPAHGGTFYAWLNGLGISNARKLSSTSTSMTVPSLACTAQLSFWLRIDTAETTATSANDNLKVQIRSMTSGVWSKWSTGLTFSNLNASSNYAQQVLDLSAYKGHAIQVRFSGKENSSLQTSFVIDDVAIDVTQ